MGGDWMPEDLRRQLSYRPAPEFWVFFLYMLLALGCMYHVRKVDLKDEQIKTVSGQLEAERKAVVEVRADVVALSRGISNNVLRTPDKLDDAAHTIHGATKGAGLRYEQQCDLQGGIKDVKEGAQEVREVVKTYNDLVFAHRAEK